MEENHKGKVWGVERGMEVRCTERFLWGWGLKGDWEAVGAF